MNDSSKVGDTTLDLLNYSLSATSPKLVVDESEDEIFFGEKKGEKELYGKNSKYNRRKTLQTFKSRLEMENQENVSPTATNIPDILVTTPMTTLKLSSQHSERPRSPLKDENNGDPLTEAASILDVNNDRIFDDSVFTEYTNHELSTVSNQIMDEWKKRSILEETIYPGPEDPFEAWFQEEREMLILYEIFGESYDEEFEKLCYEEKKEIKNRVMASEPKSVEELMAMYPDEDYHEHSLEESIHRRLSVSPEKKKVVPKKDVRPSENAPFDEWFCPEEELILFDLLGLEYVEIFEEMDYSEKLKLRDKVDVTEPKSSEEILAKLQHHQPLEEKKERERDRKSKRISILAMNVKSPVPKPRTPQRIAKPVPSPRKNVPAVAAFKTPIMTPNSGKKRAMTTTIITPSSVTPSYLRPTASSTQRFVSSPKYKDTIDRRCPKNPFRSPSPTNGLSPKTPSRKLPSTVDLSKIISPVAQYIHSNPAPPIMRIIKPAVNGNRHFLEELKESKSAAVTTVDLAEKFPPIPEATYRSSSLARQQEVAADFEVEKELPKAFGKPSTVEAKVIRHVGRVKVHNTLQWKRDEELVEDADDLIPFSPNGNKMAMGRPILKKNVRESVAAVGDETMVDMSLHEVKAVQKVNPMNKM